MFVELQLRIKAGVYINSAERQPHGYGTTASLDQMFRLLDLAFSYALYRQLM
jgi:hypothetical protein